MSAAFKNAKKKVTQSELRRYMSEQKSKLQKNVKKIDSPLAKYNENGQLTCVLCKSIVRSETVWTVHVNAKQHKENVNLAKKLKEKTNNFTVPAKRPLSPAIEDVSNKKIKSILKNSSKPAVPADFFDSKSTETVKENVQTTKSTDNDDEPMETEEITNRVNQAKIPEGFFDDPVMDAKARNQEYKDPVEEEWEKFQRELKEVDLESAAIIAEDQEEATTERQIDEIDEQLRNWSRVIDLERKKEALAAATKEQEAKENEEDSSNEEMEFNEYLDWRSKNSFK